MKTVTPRKYQSDCSDAMIYYLRKHKVKHPIAALPTGSGKTIVIVDLIEKLLDKWPFLKIVIVSHVKEIVEQDYNALTKYLDKDVDIGIYSSGFGRKDFCQITVAGIQSIYRQAKAFQNYNIVIVDEAHLIPQSGEGMYRTFISKLKKAKYFGLTATPFRLGSGYIFGKEDTLFDDLVYDLTSLNKFNDLIKQGYLCPLKTVATSLEMDTNDLNIRAGDFIERQMAAKFDKESITNMAVDEIIKHGEYRKKWLIFAIDIEHAEHIAERLMHSGIPTGVIHSKMEMNRDRILDLYRNDKLRCIVNVNVLTTGFDHPSIDLIALLRPTCSPVIHVQTVGRGLRISPNKVDCLVLDFAGNTARLGPINDIHIKEKRSKGEGGDPIVKKCPDCETLHHPTVKECPHCGYKFPFEVKISAESSGDDIIVKNRVNWHTITDIKYSKHQKKNSPPSMMVVYTCGLKRFKQFICIEHSGYAGYFARHWVKQRMDADNRPMPQTVDDLIKISDSLYRPEEIKVDESNKYPDIQEFKFAEQ